MEKSIEKALEAAGLSEREVTPFLRVRVVGLTDKCHQQKYCPREGLMTIWYPTEKQVNLYVIHVINFLVTCNFLGYCVSLHASFFSSYKDIYASSVLFLTDSETGVVRGQSIFCWRCCTN